MSSDNQVAAELTLVLVGDINSIETGSENILLNHDVQRNTEQISDRLYDLCGRHISVINLLGQPNTDRFHFHQGVHAFLLLVANGCHESSFRAGLEWFQKAFGEESLPYLMTVVTHESEDNCEGALKDLKRDSGFNESRSLTCKKSMSDEREIMSLLEKVHVMVMENNPKCCTRFKFEYIESQEEDKTESSEFQENKQCEGGKGISTPKGAWLSGLWGWIHGVSGRLGFFTTPLETADIMVRENPSCDPQPKCDQMESQEEDETESSGFQGNQQYASHATMDGRSRTLPVTFPEETETQRDEFQNLLGRLHLEEKYIQKLTPADFLKILPALKQEADTCEKDVALTFLQKLMLLDYTARSIPVRADSPDSGQEHLLPQSRSDEAENDCVDSFLRSSDSGESRQPSVHPMDIQMAVLHCSDSFLKQNLVTKLSQCQYALPLLVPDLVTMEIKCPMWTFRQIKKTWKTRGTQDNQNKVTLKSMPICKAETPLVSFFRLGSLSLSKSQLINSLINKRYNTFYHRDCDGSTTARHLMEGVVEISWYWPAGKSNDAFTDCTAFCNLHGDARDLETQRNILIDKSSVTVILISARKDSDRHVFQDLMKSPKPLIFLILEEKSNAVEFTKGKYTIGLKDRGQANVSEELKRTIQRILAGAHDSFQLESMAAVPGIRSDEEEEACKKGKAAAEKMMDLLKKTDVSEIKEKFLLCQGELWKQWCDTNKKQYRLRDQAEMEKSKKQQKLTKIREDQLKNFCGDLVNVFVEGISTLKASEKEYYLKWTQILLDDLTTDDNSSILQNYDQTWSEVLKLKENNDQSDQLKAKQQELEEISKKLQAATFGLEHIYREMAQVYEAHESLQKKPLRGQPDWSQYPKLAAELMISGHPVELMDGDAGHVPITWISRLLDEVIKKLGDKRVFVLSVLGVQSSGKSTMLNAMFGLQFAVSAGRCTKGAFMQLVNVSEDMKDLLQFDYVLVVDTEGLRSQELAGESTLHRDNELATFVIGLGDVALINIFGENPSEMQDVLQIVVQALMRMKKVQLSPRCVFVHQNVTDVAAAERNMEGKRRLQEKLDKMAQLAAEEEGYDAQNFSHVISFNVHEDVKYFAQLWEGSPPMAPPNPGYSESIQDLKNFIISKASQSTGITFSHFRSKVLDLWNALLNEDFVFSFKNTYEISVYRKLEVECGNWTWALRKEMLDIENQLHTQIKNVTVKKVSGDVLYNQIKGGHAEVMKSLGDYFEKDEDREMLVQWRHQFETKITEVLNGMVEQVTKKLNNVIQQKKACKELDDRKTEMENRLLQRSKELAQELKDKDEDESELLKHFESLWVDFVSDLTAGAKPIADVDIAGDATVVLIDLGFEWNIINEAIESTSYNKLSEAGNYSHYVTTKQNKQKQKQEKTYLQKFADVPGKVVESIWKAARGLSHEEQKMIRDLIITVEEEAFTIIETKPVETTGYNITYLVEVAKKLTAAVSEFQGGKKYSLKKEFTVDLVLYVFNRLERWLKDSHRKFKDNNDARVYAESKKEQFVKAFTAFCKGSSSAVVFAGLICDKLKCSITEVVGNDSAINLADEMRCNHPAFKGNRMNLEKHVLRSLAEKEDFDGFMTYIHKPKKHVETFITQEVEKYIKEKKNEVENIFKRNVADITKLLKQALHDATEAVMKTGRGYTELWVEELSRLTNHKLNFSISCDGFKDIERFDFLKEQIEKVLKDNEEQMRKNLSPDMLKNSRKQPEEILIQQLCDCCWVKCPFCAAVCTNTLKNHDPDKHTVPFHRSIAVNGWHYRGTTVFGIEFCTTLVASDRSFHPRHDSDGTVPFKEYPRGGERFASWQITADGSKLPFWKWFICRFQKELEAHYKYQFIQKGEIPSDWRKITKKDAITSLGKL